MSRLFATLALAPVLMIAACGNASDASDSTPPAGKAEAKAEYKKHVEDDEPSAPEMAETNPQALKIGTMHQPDSDAYCTLMRESHTFNFDDPDTWRFVFTTSMEGDPQPAQVKINDDILEFTRESRTKSENGNETWRYRSADRGIVIELNLKPTESGPEYTNYSGNIAIVEPTETERMGIKGSCGV
ncbi:hypothetical protein [Henriciella litoralis]|uniref:hypothetical protein n=1 Tax=Henriciella litoralis TaxID=568102 RepID=UPI000A034C92|nr:hypothetical protein [Henriciella litoralis]